MPPQLNTTGLLSWAEIARILKVPESTVKRQYGTALRKLRTELLREGVSEQEFLHYLYLREATD